MNQFVDLDEDGSFEVHFGKVLSSPPAPSPLLSPPSVAPDHPEKAEIIGRRGSRFSTVVDPMPNRYRDVDGDRAEALGLVSRAIKRIGPAVVRLETETHSDYDEGGGNVGPAEKLERKSEQRQQQQQQQRDSNNKGQNNGDLATNDDEGRGDIFDGVPGAPPPPSDDRAGGGHVDFGQGSGIIINGEGYILTNAHVVEGATRVYVLLTDGRRFKAELRGSDDIVDVAVLKIVPEFGGRACADSDEHRLLMAGLPVAELGDSDLMEVGNFVTAIGSPGGLDNTCTIGIVSGLKRCPEVVGIPDKFGVLDYIQTDAASAFVVSCSFHSPPSPPGVCSHCLTVPFHCWSFSQSGK
jgi:S1-C subfamily serine protease